MARVADRCLCTYCSGVSGAGLTKIGRFLNRLRVAVEGDRVVVTDYAVEGAEALGWDEWDVVQQLLQLTAEDWFRCEQSRVRPEETLWVFTPDLRDAGILWIRLQERSGVVVVSFHRG